MQTEKALINHFLRVSEVSWKFHIPTIKIFVLIYLWNLLFSWKVAYFLTVSIVFSVYKLNNFKTRTAMNAEISVYVIWLYIRYYIICITVPLKKLYSSYCYE